MTLIVDGGEPSQGVAPWKTVLTRARAVAEGVYLARDLTNTPSDRKCPKWLAERAGSAAAGVAELRVAIWDEKRLETAGFGAVLAVGRGSANPPRLVQLGWNPPGARTHVVLVGKGITFDTGGINVKSRDSMKLMRKDMGAAATVIAATVVAARLQLPVRITTLAPLAENAFGGDAMRPGDVVRHWGGLTTEVLNTDAEGRLVLADTLAYVTATECPDVVIDLATLTGAQSVALGKRTAALFTESDHLAVALSEAATAAGESLWRLPLVEDYRDCLTGQVADLANIAMDRDPGAGAVVAALFLREFTGAARSRWAHLDISGPAWSDSATGELAKGATGWGVRTIVNFLDSLA
jgi:leucyl aminopeptidase